MSAEVIMAEIGLEIELVEIALEVDLVENGVGVDVKLVEIGVDVAGGDGGRGGGACRHKIRYRAVGKGRDGRDEGRCAACGDRATGGAGRNIGRWWRSHISLIF